MNPASYFSVFFYILIYSDLFFYYNSLTEICLKVNIIFDVNTECV